ncbi:MAG: VCBS repeat-containing protein [Pseudomonadota bacterium]|nr:VCBS repeat-containing protein [Pseudomonadota bacterium]
MFRWLRVIVCSGCLIWVGEAQSTELRAQSNVALANPPAAVAARDMNWDFIPDLVVANTAANTITVNSLNSFGSMDATFDYVVGSGPVALALADYSGDGYIDIAVANQTAGTISVLNNKAVAGAEFNPAASYAAGNTPVAMVAGLFNSDLFYDLVVVNQTNNSVTLLLNSGTGSFPTMVTYGVGASPSAVVAADFDGNGSLDLAVANQGDNTVSLLLNNGSGGFAAALTYAVGSSPSAIAALDMDRNGTMDLAITHSTAATLSLLSNNGSAIFAFAASYSVGVNPVAVVAVDMNGDGYADLAVANAGSGTMSLLENNRNGAFAVGQTAAVGSTPVSIVAADIDVDGDSDLLIANAGSSNLSILTNDTDFRPAPFQFTDQVDIARNAVVESNVITLTGMTGWGRITVSRGEYTVSTDSGLTWSPWSSTSPLAVTAGDKVKLRVTASAQGYTRVDVDVLIGGVLDTFSVRTFGDSVPDPFLFVDQTGVALSTILSSNVITVTGIDIDVAISVVGGSYSLNGGAFTPAPGFVRNNDTVQLRVTSAPLRGEAVNVALYIGGVTDTFTITTAAAASSGGGGGGSLGLMQLLLLLPLLWRLYNPSR